MSYGKRYWGVQYCNKIGQTIKMARLGRAIGRKKYLT